MLNPLVKYFNKYSMLCFDGGGEQGYNHQVSHSAGGGGGVITAGILLPTYPLVLHQLISSKQLEFLCVTKS